MLGAGVGLVGLSLDDFDRLTPPEFEEIFEQYRLREEAEERGAWERARMTAMFSVQPYSRRNLKPKDICRFPWDDEGRKTDEKPMSAKEIRERYEQLVMDEIRNP